MRNNNNARLSVKNKKIVYFHCRPLAFFNYTLGKQCVTAVVVRWLIRRRGQYTPLIHSSPTYPPHPTHPSAFSGRATHSPFHPLTHRTYIYPTTHRLSMNNSSKAVVYQYVCLYFHVPASAEINVPLCRDMGCHSYSSV